MVHDLHLPELPLIRAGVILRVIVAHPQFPCALFFIYFCACVVVVLKLITRRHVRYNVSSVDNPELVGEYAFRKGSEVSVTYPGCPEIYHLRNFDPTPYQHHSRELGDRCAQAVPCGLNLVVWKQGLQSGNFLYDVVSHQLQRILEPLMHRAIFTLGPPLSVLLEHHFKIRHNIDHRLRASERHPNGLG